MHLGKPLTTPSLSEWFLAVCRTVEKLWLVWAGQTPVTPPILLGGGKILGSQWSLYKTNILWTNFDIPGLNSQASQLQYPVGNQTSFLVLQLAPNLPLANFPVLGGIGPILSMFNQASPQQVSILNTLLPIP